jgi:NADH-quinone oxidoreductase subunit H
MVFFAGKMVFFLFAFMWVRWTLPRFRYDQLMSLGWRFLLPLALGYITITATTILALDALEINRAVPSSGVLYQLGISPFWGIMGVLNVLMAIGVFFILDRGRIVSPAYSRISMRQLAALRSMSVPSPISPPAPERD